MTGAVGRRRGVERRSIRPVTRARGRLRRGVAWLVSLLLVAVTFCALAVDATNPPDTIAPDHGSDLVLGAVDGGTRERPFVVHHERWGSHGSPVLLLPGFAESSVSWTPTAVALSRDHVVEAIDLPGWGYTSRTGRYTLTDEVDVVRRFIVATHLERPVVVGHSMGAAVAGELARTQPRLVAGVVFADGDALPLPGGRHLPGWAFRGPLVSAAYRGVTHNRWAYAAIMRDQCGSVCRALTPELERAWMRPFGQRDAERSIPALAGVGVLAMTPETIGAITVPRGIIWGSEDTTSGGSRADTEVNLHHPPEVLLQKAGHLVQLADPEGFAGALDTIEDHWAHA